MVVKRTGLAIEDSTFWLVTHDAYLPQSGSASCMDESPRCHVVTGVEPRVWTWFVTEGDTVGGRTH